jgi:hypothetical protein
MTHSTFRPEAVLAADNYALPHATDLSGQLRPVPVAAEGFALATVPSGGLWSSARETARYV